MKKLNLDEILFFILLLLPFLCLTLLSVFSIIKDARRMVNLENGKVFLCQMTDRNTP